MTTATDELLDRLRKRNCVTPLDQTLLADAADLIERLTAERDGLRDVIDGTLAQAIARLEKCEAERNAALEDAQDVPMLRLAVRMLVRAVRGTPGGVATLGRLAVDCPVAMSVLAAQKGDDHE